ncbi:hypothetical protein HDU86_000832 [Geranomyces michiganensis]|nr:hypothetical protein HDU86_000832 [Geranomyces michiganensis]
MTSEQGSVSVAPAPNNSSVASEHAPASARQANKKPQQPRRCNARNRKQRNEDSVAKESSVNRAATPRSRKVRGLTAQNVKGEKPDKMADPATSTTVDAGEVKPEDERPARTQSARARRQRAAKSAKNGDQRTTRAADPCRTNVPTSATEATSGKVTTKAVPVEIVSNEPQPPVRRPLPVVPVSRPAVSRPAPRTLEDKLASTTDPILRASLTRTLDLEKLERRFRSCGYKLCSSTSASTVIAATLAPSDPDFPYDLLGLDLEITLPASYPLTPATISVKNQEIPLPLRKGIEKAWLKKAAGAKIGSLAMINWLDRQLEELLIQNNEPPETIRFVKNAKTEKPTAPRELSLGVLPPAVATPKNTGASDSDATTSWADESNNDDDAESEDAQVAASSLSAVTQHKGVQIRLPLLRLMNIALLQCTSLNFVVRCNRCKHAVDMLNLLPDAPQPRWTACSQCNTDLGARYRGMPLHPSAPSIGYLDVEMCTVYDLLPSNYLATCGSCATPQAVPGGFRAVIRGYPTDMRCHTCNATMTLGIEDVKFVNLQPTSLPHNAGLKLKKKPRKAKDDVTLVVGTPLPKNGTCSHYKQSYRWFRFPCCGKLYPCDLCHAAAAAGTACAPDADSGRPRLATRVVCGFCSRESAYAPSVATCACGKAMVRERHPGGFWEGGKGTRDRQKMNRNDPRKFAGLSKTVSMKSARVGKKHDG